MSLRRVLSLSPSCTEMVCALGAADRLAGRSHLCDYPAEIAGRPVCTAAVLPADSNAARNGLLLHADETLIASLAPDLILSDWPRGVVTGLAPGRSVIGKAPERTPDVWANIQAVAEALDMAEQGRVLLSSLKTRFVDIISQSCQFNNRTEVACLDSVAPLTTAGWWIPELVEFAGGQSLFAQAGKPSMPLEWTALECANPEMILVMVRGLDLPAARRAAEILAAHPQWRKLAAVRSKKVFLTDASHFLMRPGPRVVESLQLLAEILHPKTFPFGGENKRWQRL